MNRNFPLMKATIKTSVLNTHKQNVTFLNSKFRNKIERTDISFPSQHHINCYQGKKDKKNDDTLNTSGTSFCHVYSTYRR